METRNLEACCHCFIVSPSRLRENLFSLPCWRWWSSCRDAEYISLLPSGSGPQWDASIRHSLPPLIPFWGFPWLIFTLSIHWKMTWNCYDTDLDSSIFITWTLVDKRRLPTLSQLSYKQHVIWGRRTLGRGNSISQRRSPGVYRKFCHM